MARPNAMGAENAGGFLGSFDVIGTQTSGVKQIPFEKEEAIKLIEKLMELGTYKFADENHILLEVDGTLLKIFKVQP